MFIGYSLWPIRLFTVLGAVFLGVGLISGFVLLLGWLTSTWTVPGWGIVLWAIGTGVGLNLLFLGVVGEYLGKLFMAHSGLPPYVEKSSRP